jgi:probable F420-dependent oxidoreductase
MRGDFDKFNVSYQRFFPASAFAGYVIVRLNKDEKMMELKRTAGRIRVGVLLHPQLTTFASYSQAVQEVEGLGVDTIWTWDHFFPTYQKRRPGSHFEAWTLLASMAMLTNRSEVGTLVTCHGYRNTSLLAIMAKTVDHISSGRLILGIGAGWLEEEFKEYGYPFGTAGERIKALGEAIPVIKKRWEEEGPPPVRGKIPILIGGEGEMRMLKLVAQYADIWNAPSPPGQFEKKNRILDTWCEEIGRNPREIERSVLTMGSSEEKLEKYLKAGAEHIIFHLMDPWKFTAVEKMIKWRDKIIQSGDPV